MIYVDTILEGNTRCHMWADDLAALHAVAKKIGVKRCWFHGVRKGHPHYDVNRKQQEAAMNLGGAIQIAWKTWYKNGGGK